MNGTRFEIGHRRAIVAGLTATALFAGVLLALDGARGAVLADDMLATAPKSDRLPVQNRPACSADASAPAARCVRGVAYTTVVKTDRARHLTELERVPVPIGTAAEAIKPAGLPDLTDVAEGRHIVPKAQPE